MSLILMVGLYIYLILWSTFFSGFLIYILGAYNSELLYPPSDLKPLSLYTDPF